VNGKRKVLSVLGILIFGIMLGRLHTGTPEVQTRVVEKQVVVEKPYNTAQPYMPESCARVIDMATRVRDAAGTFDTATGPQEDILGQAAKAISERSVTAVNAAIAAQRKLRGSTLGAADTLHTELFTYEEILTKCKKELKPHDDEGS
jgi:hypothetical protein